MAYQKVKNIWWENNNLYIQLHDDSIMEYRDASIKDVKVEFSNEKDDKVIEIDYSLDVGYTC